MNIFVAGGTGAIGRYLVPLLVKDGHKVIALTRSADRTAQLERMGATPVVGDVFAEARLAALVADAEAEVVIHQLTAFGTTTGDPYAETIRVRIEGTRNLVAAARAARARRFIAQSISFVCSPAGGGLTDEDTPLYRDGPAALRPLVDAVASLERQTLEAGGTVLRYGWFFGRGTSYDPQGMIPTAIRKGAYPIVGAGAGAYSFIDLRDAAAATMNALARDAKGIYNIVNDAPVRLSDWLPFAAQLLGAPAPGRMDEALARQKLGDMRVYYLNEQRGASNAKARRELDWRPAWSWRASFEALYGKPQVRAFAEKDRAALEAIYRDCRAEAKWLPPEVKARSNFAKDTDGEAMLVAVGDNGEPVGFVSVWESDQFVHHLYVRNPWRRRGVGKALLDALEARMPKPWRLKCTRANSAALAFYSALGWREISAGNSEDGPFALLERT